MLHCSTIFEETFQESVMSPFNFLAAQTRFATFVIETQTVMALRLMGLSGALPARPGETERMFSEKPMAFFDAQTAGLKAMISGKSPDQIFDAAMKPLSRKVSANRRRLLR